MGFKKIFFEPAVLHSIRFFPTMAPRLLRQSSQPMLN